MRHELRRFLREESGEDLIEYGLLVAFAAALVTAVLLHDPLAVKQAIIAAFQHVVDAFSAS